MIAAPAASSRHAQGASREWRLLVQLAVLTVLTLSGGAIAGRWFGLEEFTQVRSCQPGEACQVVRLESPAIIIVRLASGDHLPQPSAGVLPEVTRVEPTVARLAWDFVRPIAPLGPARGKRQRAPPLQAL